MSTYQPYVDGYWGAEKEITVIPRPSFPFKDNPSPDIFSRVYDRDFRVIPKYFLPKIANRTSSTNLLSYSEDLSNAAWTKTNATITTDSASSPDGRGSFQKVLETVTNAEHAVIHSATIGTGPATHEVMIFAKAGLTREWIKVGFVDFGGNPFSAFFNIKSGILGTVAGTTEASITPMGSGIFRCTLRFAPAVGAGTLKVNVASDASTVSYAGNTAYGVYLWGAQIGLGINLPYISTTSSTRAVIAPDRDEFDPFAYLVVEDQPQIVSSVEAIARRKFARVPLTQAVPSSIRLTKPSFSGSLPQTVGSYLVSQPDSAQQAFDAYYRQFVSNDTGSAAGVGGALTGGTYTISFDGQTTSAIAYNASAAALASALNALSTVSDRGGLSVTGDYLTGFTITFSNIPYMSSVNTGSLTGASPITGIVTSSGGTGFGQSFQINGAPAGGTITGGTFTITIFGQTTAAIAHNASVGTVQSAINALSLVATRGGVTSFATPDPILWNGNGQINVSFIFLYPAFTVNMTSALPSGSTATVTRLDPINTNGVNSYIGRQQSISFSGVTVGTRTITTPSAHGITTADNIYVKAGTGYFLVAAGNFTVPTTSTIAFSTAASAVAVSTDVVSEVGKRVRQNYQPGTVTVRCVRTSYFYLPGVTSGISTADDIVPPTYQGDSTTFLQAIFAGAGTINYDVGELQAWLGPILSLTVITVRASDL